MLSPLLFIAVVDLSRKTVMKDAMKKLLHADDLALVANRKQELQETLEERNGLFTRHVLKLSLEKTEVLHIGHIGHYTIPQQTTKVRASSRKETTSTTSKRHSRLP